MPDIIEKNRSFTPHWESGAKRQRNPLRLAQNAVTQLVQFAERQQPTWVVSFAGRYVNFFIRRRFGRFALLEYFIAKSNTINLRQQAQANANLSKHGQTESAEPTQWRTSESERQHQFVLSVARFLQSASLQGHFKRLVIVADASDLSILKQTLSHSVRNQIVLELDTDTSTSDPEHLDKQLTLIRNA